MLEEKDKIFTNLYGQQDWRLKHARARGDWTQTGEFIQQKSHPSIQDGFFVIWLPGHPQNPNFSYEVILGLTNAKKGERWIILNQNDPDS